MSDLDDPAYREIIRARVKLLFEEPFYGQLAARLIAVEQPGARWSTDGRHLFYDREMILAATKAERLFAMKRVVSGLVVAAFGRRNRLDPLTRVEIVSATLQTCAIVGETAPRWVWRLTGPVASSEAKVRRLSGAWGSGAASVAGEAK